MTDMISFPHLGIHFPFVPQDISIGGFHIALYGICVALAMIGGISLAVFLAKRTGQNPEHYVDYSMVGMVLCILGARIYYVIFTWDYYSHNLLEIFNLRAGGLAIYGGVIMGIVSVLVFCRIKKLHTLQFMDTAAAGLAFGQMIGRWGNFFNREVFGGYTDGLLAMQLPLDAVSRSDVTQEMLDHLQTVDGVQCIQVHPTFLYESLWNLCLALVLSVLVLKGYKLLKGEVFCLYLLGYGLGRFWIEGIRTDRLLIAGTDLAVSQLLSAALVIGSIGAVVIRRMLWKKSRQRG